MQTALSSQNLTIIINHFGAELCSILDKNQTEFMWQAQSEWQRYSPVLFPIVGKLKNNTYSFKNNTYELKQHGFARDIIFTLISSTKNACTFELKSSSETKKNYPFDFTFQIHYELIKNKLTISYSVNNPSQNQLYFSVGAHPAFSCQLNGNDTLEDYYLKFEKPKFIMSALNDGLIRDEKIDLEIYKNKLLLYTNLFDNDALVFGNSQINKVSLCSIIGNQKVTLESKNWPYFGIWTKKNSNKFICFEPWYCIADSETNGGSFENKKGIISLNPQSNFSCSYSITINS